MIACCFIARRTNHQTRLKQMSGNIWNICHRCTFNILKLSVYPHRIKWMNNLLCMASVSLFVQGWFFFFLSSVLWCPLRFPHKSDVSFSLLPVGYGGLVSYLPYLFVCAEWCPTHIVLCVRYSLTFIQLY